MQIDENQETRPPKPTTFVNIPSLFEIVDKVGYYIYLHLTVLLLGTK